MGNINNVIRAPIKDTKNTHGRLYSKKTIDTHNKIAPGKATTKPTIIETNAEDIPPAINFGSPVPCVVMSWKA